MATRYAPQNDGRAMPGGMLRLALSYCRSLGMTEVRLGCYADNTASVRTIEGCGGHRTEEKPYADGKPMYLYTVALNDRRME